MFNNPFKSYSLAVPTNSMSVIYFVKLCLCFFLKAIITCLRVCFYDLMIEWKVLLFYTKQPVFLFSYSNSFINYFVIVLST